MKQLKQCIKKEALELLRGKKLYIFLGIALGMVALNVFLITIVSSIGDIMTDESGAVVSFTKSLSSSISMYASTTFVYYTIPAMFMCMGIVAKEIKQKKWILPVSSGIRTENIMISKFIVHVGCILLCVTLGYFVNVAVACAAFEVDTGFADVMLIWLGLAVMVLLYVTLTISLSSITKSSAFAIIIPLVLMFLLEPIFGVLEISTYTPFLFSLIMSYGGLVPFTATEWLVASLTTACVVLGMVVWATYNPRLSIV